jgi:hypothetical protein
MIAFVRFAAAFWVLFATLIFRPIALSPNSFYVGFALMTTETLPAAAGAFSILRWLFGHADPSALAFATRWAALLGLVALPLPLLLGVVPVDPADLAYRVLQAAALVLLIDGALGPGPD